MYNYKYLSLFYSFLLSIIFFPVLLKLSEDLANNIMILRIKTRNIHSISKNDYNHSSSMVCIAIPILIVDKQQIDNIFNNLAMTLKNNSDAHLTGAYLLFDLPDSIHESPENSYQLLIEYSKKKAKLSNSMSKKGVHNVPIYVLYRRRHHNSSKDMWTCRDRKLGNIISFLSYMSHQENDHIEILCDQTDVQVEHCVFIDEDTILCDSSVENLHRIALHPRNRPVISEDRSHISKGYGIIQPLCSDGLASLFHRRFDFVIFGQTKYHGKGLYDIGASLEIFKNGFPDLAKLSHDFYEGILLRCGYAPRSVILSDVESSFRQTYLKGIRWARGDWQNFYSMLGSTYIRSRYYNLFSRVTSLMYVTRSIFPLSFFCYILFSMLVENNAIFVPLFIFISRHIFTIYSIKNKNVPTFDLIKIFLNFCYLDISMSCFLAVAGLHSFVSSLYSVLTGKNILSWETSAQVSRGYGPRFDLFSFHCMIAILVPFILLLKFMTSRQTSYVIGLIFGLWLVSAVIIVYKQLVAHKNTI